MQTSSDRWQRMETLFYKCLDIEPDARSSFLEENCGGDTALRKEVEALLDEAGKPMDLLEQPVFEAAHGVVKESSSGVLNPGVTIGHYEIISLLSRGGMGQVYLAEDTSLERKVAFKVLAPGFIYDDRGLARFQREARAASTLNHPNIVTIYEFGEIEGLYFIASEFVDGATLRQKLTSGKLDLKTAALDIGIQISIALAAAHSAGIIHRDIKPENVMVRSDGLVKVLDFGIAKLSTARTVHRRIPAPLDPVTQPGMLIGTVAYMSPEQAAGKELDLRSDLFSFGAVLYEMATGATPFPGDNASAVIEAILSRSPMPPLQLNPELPKKLVEIITRALEKDRSARFQEASEMRSALEWLQRELHPHRSIVMVRPAAGDRKKRWPWITVGALVLTMVLLAGYFLLPGAAKLTDKDTVVLADFSNTTNDSVFDGTLRQGLSAQLEQSPFLNLLSDDRIAQTLSLMARPKDTRLTAELTREVCQRTASAATIEGSIASLGTQYVLGLRAVNCRNGDVLAEEQVTADGKEHVLNALGEAATKLRSRLGESLASVEKYDAPPENVTTSSLEALQAYSLGYREMVVMNDYVAAVPLFERAISLDPKFAMAYARLGTTYINLDETERTADNLRNAYELRQTVSERERFYIDSHYQMLVTGDMEAARKTLELWAAAYPRDRVPPNNLGYIYAVLGYNDKSLAAHQDSLKLDPGSGNSYLNVVDAYVRLNRLNEAKATAQQAQARHFEASQIHNVRYLIDFLEHDVAGMQREADSQLGVPGGEDVMLYSESDTAAYAGHFAKARELTNRAVDSALHAGEKEIAAGYKAEAAVREALVGNIGRAKQQAQAALAMSKGRDVEVISAVALALTGDSAESKRLANDLAAHFPRDTIVQFNELPTIHAANAITSGNIAEAIQALVSAGPYDLGDFGQSLTFALYPVYLRGLALLAARQGPAAAVEFKKIVDHSGIVVNEPIGALAHLGLGRAYVIAGSTEKARHAYQDFLTLWKDADSDIPVFKQARAEYAKLQ